MADLKSPEWSSVAARQTTEAGMFEGVGMIRQLVNERLRSSPVLSNPKDWRKGRREFLSVAHDHLCWRESKPAPAYAGNDPHRRSTLLYHRGNPAGRLEQFRRQETIRRRSKCY